MRWMLALAGCWLVGCVACAAPGQAPARPPAAADAAPSPAEALAASATSPASPAGEAPSDAGAPAAPVHVLAVYGTASTSNAHLQLALDQGIFAGNGLDVELAH